MASPGALEIYWNLVTAAHADDGISPVEEQALRPQAERLGLSRAEAEEVRRQVTTAPRIQLKIPQDAGRRWQALCALLDVAAADGTLSPREVALAQGLARAAGVPPARLPALLKAALQPSPGARKRGYEKCRPVAAPGAAAPVAPVPEPAPTAEPVTQPPAWVAPPGPLDFLEVEPPTQTIDWPKLEPLAARAAPVPARSEVLRSVPVLNRLAPTLRACTRCGMSFGDRNRYERTCPTCRENRFSASPVSFIPFWIASAAVAALLLQAGFRFYTWWWDEAIMAAWQYFLHRPRSSYRGRRSSFEGLVLVLAVAAPFVLTALLGFIVAALPFYLWNERLAKAGDARSP